ncbi:MAG: MBL fold metallo-hydrolase [Candidatus Kerfeldbacteria bacterium]|nr:MBL fold metallo-hydrolase [Candidatus Kerfeldbacteria bacterium]
MTITKLGHCCLVIKEGALTILTDPGTYSTAQNSVTGVDVILITHEHPDHYHLDSLRKVLANNPQAKIYTVKAVGALLDKEGIQHQLLTDGGRVTEKGVSIEGFGKKHHEMYPGWPRVDNTGYFVANRLWYPGDALYDPGKTVEILALPVAGPWLNIREATDYAKQIHPKMAFAVHDAVLVNPGTAHRVPAKFLPEEGIEFKILEIGKEYKL